MKFPFLIILCLYGSLGYSQTQSLSAAIDKLLLDEQFANATVAFSVRDAAGKMIFERNGNLGINPASSLKVVTSATAFSLLGKDFTFSTRISLGVSSENKGRMLVISGGGDPTFGSDRWKHTQPEIVLKKISDLLKALGITEVPGGIYIHHPNFSYQPLPHGWLWEDIGNYFGAGAWGLNWRENVFEIDMVPGAHEGDPVTVTATRPAWFMERITSFVTTGEKGSGDQSLVFSAPYQDEIFITGTVPKGSKISVSASVPDPAESFGFELKEFLQKVGIASGPVETFNGRLRKGKALLVEPVHQLGAIISPPFDSINYWFMNKSINLYGEALIKMIALNQNREASTENGVMLVKNFWQSKRVEAGGLKMLDGSGLSPTNRVTTNSLTKVLHFSQNEPWFNSFYKCLPDMNNMKLKSGYMEGVRSYTGIITSGTGKKYFVAFAINNFHGSAAAVRQKMWKVLDVLL